jgi:integrase
MPRFIRCAAQAPADQLGLEDHAVLCQTTFHDLRHTFASTALAEGVPISEVSRRLGALIYHDHIGSVQAPGS